jgi:voltage-gated potassium channel
MKAIGTQLAFILGERQMRLNIRALLRYLLFLIAVIALFTILFHFIMVRVEGQDQSWVSGLYWTLTTMSTLGYGDITFQTDFGRLFSAFVLVSGMVLFLIVLPFAVLNYFLVPWVRAQVRSRAPRSAPEDASGHVIICSYDSIAPGLIERLEWKGQRYFVIEPDPDLAARLHGDGVSVVSGEVDSPDTYARLRADRAAMVLGNLDDITNTNITLTVRDVAPDVLIAVIASNEDSIDLLQLAGANHVLPLRRQLGEQLANRINAGHAQTHVIGTFKDLLIAEFPVLNTPFTGHTIRETRLREVTGLNVVGVWEQARLIPATADTPLSELSLPIVVGTREQIDELDEVLFIYDTNYHPVLVVGGGKVGRAATRALQRKGIEVNMIEREPALAGKLEGIPDRLFLGDAANLELLTEAGLEDAPSVLLTTNDDAMNIYLAVYCRRLRPDVRIVSRITHQRNMASIRRAGADLALSYANLGVEVVAALLSEEELVILGQGIELYALPVPESLAGKSLGESEIGARTGMNVVAIEEGEEVRTSLGASTVLSHGAHLMMIGSHEQLEDFRARYPD